MVAGILGVKHLTRKIKEQVRQQVSKVFYSLSPPPMGNRSSPPTLWTMAPEYPLSWLLSTCNKADKVFFFYRRYALLEILLFLISENYGVLGNDMSCEAFIFDDTSKSFLPPFHKNCMHYKNTRRRCLCHQAAILSLSR